MNLPLKPWLLNARLPGLVGSAPWLLELMVLDALGDSSMALKCVFQGSFCASTWARTFSSISLVRPTPGCLKPLASMVSLMAGW
ncbi:hypothetical protein D9M68_996000 [compost metagenome]